MAHQISKRTKRIIELLIEQDTYVSGNWIAKQLGVSKRTVLREMNEVERHVKEKWCGPRENTRQRGSFKSFR